MFVYKRHTKYYSGNHIKENEMGGTLVRIGDLEGV